MAFGGGMLEKRYLPRALMLKKYECRFKTRPKTKSRMQLAKSKLNIFFNLEKVTNKALAIQRSLRNITNHIKPRVTSFLNSNRKLRQTSLTSSLEIFESVSDDPQKRKS